ncbi:CHAT domain-containing protein [Scytonema hofmannii FACHB-248]|uniref:CHAT domain-containing protein n=1 Tax=Scytonema hofmannii FACHB-248 TaxID=1842502 RepID=A0ABR8GMM6_9CYAN|nr:MULTISPECIES: CHAT domain-containing protein [Nostocales]MBD2604662.1 CHAT domain-containing protein [Scytonema hofmannii FACHB-248]
MWTSCAVSIFLSLLLLSESTAASVGGYGLQIAQQTVPPSSIPLSPDKQQRYQEGVKLYQEGQELDKKGTKEAYQQALEKYQQALKIFQELGLRKEEVEILVYIGWGYSAISEEKTALIYLQQALEKTQQLKPLYRASILGSIGLIYSTVGKLDDGLNYLKKAELIFLEQKKLGSKEFGLLASYYKSIATAYNRKGEPEKAFTYLDKALKIYRDTLKSVDGEASVLEDIGFIHSLRGETSKAFEKYNQALAIFEKTSNLPAQAQILNHIASLHQKLGKYEEAIKNLDKARKLLEKVEGAFFQQASIVASIGDVYGISGDYQTAIQYYQQARTLYYKAGDTKLDKSLGDYQSSINYYTKALDIYKQIGDKPQQAITHGFIGSVYEISKNYGKALISYEQALVLLNKEDYQSEILTLRGMVRIYNSMKNYSKALETAKSALFLSKGKGKNEEFKSLSVLADVYYSNGDYQKALEIYQTVLLYFQQAGFRLDEADILSNIGMTYTLSNQHQLAINTYNEELKLRRTLKNGTDEADALYGIAINQRELGKLEAALPNIEEAIKIVENIRGNVQSQDLRTSYFATVQGYYKFYIDLLMELHKKDPSKICEFTTKDQNTNKDIIIKDKCKAVALHISERSRARGLVELLTEARANIRKGANPELLAEESRLQALINTKEKLRQEIVSNIEKINNPIYKARADKFQTEIDELLSQQKQLETKIRQSSPKYANLKYPQPLTLPQIQQQLDKDTLLLEYSLGKERSYLWAVTPNSIDSYELPGRKEIEEAVKEFRETLIRCQKLRICDQFSPEEKAQALKNTAFSATKLSQIILAPVADKLGKKRLVIVADGALQKIPFAALNDLTPQPPSLRSRSVSKRGKGEQDKLPSPRRGGVGGEVEYQPLIVNHEIVNLPSVTAIATQRQELKGRKTAPKTLAILADPVFEANDIRITGKSTSNDLDDVGSEVEQSQLKQAGRNLNRNGFGRLKGTETEANAILKLVPSDNLQAFGFNANYNWVTNPQLSQYRFLHFATHGIADLKNPELSGIVLSLFLDKQAKPADKGYLRLGDIFNLNFAADLIVLSACDTGEGKDVNGEGLVGLTRGLMYAGAERVAVSLWQVDDKGAPELMEEFYTQMLKQGKSPTAALRATQLKLWENSSLKNPYYWSAFTLQGEWR